MSSILFTSICNPPDRLLGVYASSDQMAFRLTRNQGLFTLYEHTHISSLHLLAQNILEPSVVLEYPTLDQLAEELKRGYDYVAVSFKPCNTEKLLEMLELVRRKSPRSKTVVGGYGVICAPEIARTTAWGRLVDHACLGDGIPFVRRLLGHGPPSSIRCMLPKIGASLPWFNRTSVGTVGIILSGLGCTQRCPFCVTSASTNGRYLEVMSVEDIFTAMQRYWSHSSFTKTSLIYDENLLDHTEKVRRLGKLIREDRVHGLRRLNYFAFASLSALAKYDLEELLLHGLDTVWIGVESKFSDLNKRQGRDPQETFRALHQMGIKTVGSWIAGWDFQTPENIEGDLDYFVSLDPTYQQLALLGVVPPLPLWQSMRNEGRIPETVRWRDYHIYGHTLNYAHFSHRELLDLVDRGYRRIYEEHGPSLLKELEINLNGYEWCLRSSNPLLREQKAGLFRDRCQAFFPVVRTAIAHAPSEKVRGRARQVDRRYRELLGPPTSAEESIAEQMLRMADAEVERRQQRAPATREEPFRRYVYGEGAPRVVGKPYSVTYPAGDPS